MCLRTTRHTERHSSCQHGGVGDLVDVESLSDALRAVDNLEESLLRSLTWVKYGYAVELQFEHLRSGRRVPESAVVTVTMEAVSALQLVGGLSPEMVADGAINWGLSEVAVVNSYPAAPGVGLRVAWEGECSITVEAARAYFSVSRD
jgi:hypothetical protein